MKNLNQDQYKTLYALSTLKLPLATTASRMLGIDVSLVRGRIDTLVDYGLLDRKSFGDQRVMFLLTLAGQATLDTYIKEHGAPEVLEIKPQGSRPHKSDTGYTPVERDSATALPRQLSWKDSGPYESPKDAFYRNDGNKHIKSRGAF